MYFFIYTVDEATNQLRLETDINISQEDQEDDVTRSSSGLLHPIKLPKRRRSPVTVQEWVASLPIPHLLTTNR